MFFSRQCSELIELGMRERKRLLDDYVRARRKRGAAIIGLADAPARAVQTRLARSLIHTYRANSST